MLRKILKYLSFGLICVIIVLLIVATVVEKYVGTNVVIQYLYCSPLVVALWIVTSLVSLVYLITMKVQKRFFTFMIHISFLLILLGALVTHICGDQGTVHLRADSAPTTEYSDKEGNQKPFPFSVTLKSFDLEYYTGSLAPMDFVSTIEIKEGREIFQGKVSMNNIFSHRNYRFYQSGYDKDGQGTILSISYDPYGIALTYAGYLLLLLSMICFFFQRRSGFTSVLKSLSAKQTKIIAIVLLSLFGVNHAKAVDTPPVLPENVANAFGDIYVYYNDRICPLQTMAKDFTVKLYGADSYKGLSSEQVFTAWFFYYDDWKTEPIIRIKDSNVRQLLGITSNYASLSDFTDINGYKLDDALSLADNIRQQDLLSANEKFNIVSMACTGSSLKIFPYSKPDDAMAVSWFSLTDKLPDDMSAEQWGFVRNSLNYLAETIAAGRFEEAEKILHKIKKFQTKEAASVLDSSTKYKVEKAYNTYNFVRPLAMGCVAVGLILFVLSIRAVAKNDVKESRWYSIVNRVVLITLILVFIYLTILISARGYVAGHFPLSNGYETMVFMAWCSLLLSLIFSRRFFMSFPFGFLLCGLTLMVAMIGNANPQITQLMPVLQSPLLSIHVVTIMVSYSLLAFMMLNGITALVWKYTTKNSEAEIEKLAKISRMMLYPAVFLLTAGIFIGAVWANVSWGRYWGWDPKEVWALITMLIYSFAFHQSSLSLFRRPMFFHSFCIIAFLAVLITYFGVNFFLGGMHSYA